MPIPLHFSFTDGKYVEATYSDAHGDALRDHFDVPDLAVTDDAIVNGTWQPRPGEPMPLAPFTAPRVDYSLHRLQHYTATAPQHFQNFVLFTNYQFYVDAFCQWARETLAQGEGGYLALVEPGNVRDATRRRRRAQRPGPGARSADASYHLVRENHSGITLINIGVGPSNAKTITDHVAVLRPSAWLMLGHCAGLRTTQRLGDYVLAHGYVREDHVLDADLPTWVPVPPLAEIQVGWNRPWPRLRACRAGISSASCAPARLPPSTTATGNCATTTSPSSACRSPRAIALDMDRRPSPPTASASACPTARCCACPTSPCMASSSCPAWPATSTAPRSASICISAFGALELLRNMPRERLHSRKLRSFIETAFK